MTKYLKKSAGALAGTALLGGLGFWATCVDYVKPNEQAVMQTKISVPGLTEKQGYDFENIREGGKYHIAWPVLQKLHRLPQDVQAINFSKSEPDKAEERFLLNRPAARIETSDAFYVDLDTTVFFRIDNPAKTISQIGPGRLYESSVVDKYTVPGLKAVLGELNPEDFFEVDSRTGVAKRVAHQAKATAYLASNMAPFGLTAEDVRIRYPEYVEEVQERFEEKSKEEQRVLTNRSQAALETQNALLGEKREQGTQAAEKRKDEGTAYAAKIRGETSAYEDTKKSEGDKLVELATAEATRLTNNAYQGQGAELLVGLQMAKNMCNLEQVLIPVCGDEAINPLNVGDLAKRLSGGSR